MLASSPSVNTKLQLLQTETGCKAGDKCSFPHHKVDEQPNRKNEKKATIHTKEEKVTTIMLWLIIKLHHNWVASRKTRKLWFLKEENSPGEARCKKSWDRFENYGSLGLRYVKQVFGKRKDHRLEIYK